MVQADATESADLFPEYCGCQFATSTSSSSGDHMHMPSSESSQGEEVPILMSVMLMSCVISSSVA